MDFDIAIAGSGFGGSLLAAIARRIGLKTLLIEREQHPRFAIGESTSPLANLVLEEICSDYDLPSLAPLAAHGSWKQQHPAIGCGLKRGFSFYHHRAGKPYQFRLDHANELLVAASPSNRVADTHWLRSDVDAYFCQQAQESGVEYHDNTAIRCVSFEAGGVEIQAETHGSSWRAKTAFLVDATGPRGLLSRQLSLPQSPWPHLPPARALFAHFEDVPHFRESLKADDTGQPLPYPPEWAAVHHVFDGGWIWSLRFDDEIVSAGAAVRPWLAGRLHLEEGAPAWERLLDRFPGLSHFRQAKPVRPFTYLPALPYRCSRTASWPWALLPGAAAFVDPFLSTGIPMTLLGIQRLGALLNAAWDGRQLRAEVMEAGLEGYERSTLAEADTAALLISGCYRAFAHFELLAAYVMYYFAAASYAEMAHRLHKPELAGLFLRADDPQFQEALRTSCHTLSRWDNTRGPATLKPSPAEVAAFQGYVRRSIERINVAGLLDSSRNNWYPVDLNDLVASSHCFGMTKEAMAHFAQTLPA